MPDQRADSIDERHPKNRCINSRVALLISFQRTKMTGDFTRKYFRVNANYDGE